MWGWLDGILGGLETVWESIVSLPSKISSALSSSFDTVVHALGTAKDAWVNVGETIKDAVLGLPSTIVEGIKDIFIPDTNYVKYEFDSFLQELKTKFRLDFTSFENLFQNESEVTDVYSDYTISGVGNLKLRFFDATYFVIGVEFFRPYIRGLLMLFILFYNVKQLIGFFGYDAGVVAGRSDHINSNLKSQRGGKE